MESINSGELGDIKHIRALWHRNNSWPKLDKNGKPMLRRERTAAPARRLASGYPRSRTAMHCKARSKQLGYKSMEELVRWRLFNRTGGGLMAELGSHQLDACSIFLGKVHPLAVTGVGGKIFYHDDREVDDHVFVTFEFPGPNYFADKDHRAVKDPNDMVIVTYSSINTNTFEPYGECVMGSHGTMLVEQERDVMLFPERNPNKPAGSDKGMTVTVTTASAGKPSLDSSGSTGALEPAKALATGQASLFGSAEPRLPRGNGALRLLRPHVERGQGQERPAFAALPWPGGDGRCDYRLDFEPGHAPASADRVQTRVV